MPETVLNESLETTIAEAAPLEPGHAALDRVRDRALRTPVRRAVWPRLASAALVLAVAAAGAYGIINRGPRLTMAFAEEDALAALMPPEGSVLHIKAAETPEEGHGMPYGPPFVSETWLDAQARLLRSEWYHGEERVHDSSVVVAGGRSRSLYYPPHDLEPKDEPHIVDGPVEWNEVLGVAVGQWDDLRKMVRNGEAVGEVEIDGVRYWDVRWADREVLGGTRWWGRALLRQPDYAPKLIVSDATPETPDTATSRTEYELWEVVPRSSLPSGTFDPASVNAPDAVEDRVE